MTGMILSHFRSRSLKRDSLGASLYWNWWRRRLLFCHGTVIKIHKASHTICLHFISTHLEPNFGIQFDIVCIKTLWGK